MQSQDLCELVGRDAIDRLKKYVELLGRWRPITNLISEKSFADVWERHILDAIYLQRQLPAAKCWLDIGSGAGLPAAVIAILNADVVEAQIHCVEIDRRKCAFLRETAAKLSIPIKVHNWPAENLKALDIQNIEVVTARAFANVSRILQIAEPFLSEGAVALLPRGRQSHDELAHLYHGRYSIKVDPNPSPGAGVFVRIEMRAAHSL